MPFTLLSSEELGTARTAWQESGPGPEGGGSIEGELESLEPCQTPEARPPLLPGPQGWTEPGKDS